jgi:outer membrane immunogenic protein
VSLGGLAVGDFDDTYTITVPAGHFSRFGPGTYPEKASDTAWGWTVGGGLEFAFTNNLTARAEYRYTKFDDITNASTFILPGGAAKQEPEFHAVRAGVSYKF